VEYCGCDNRWHGLDYYRGWIIPSSFRIGESVPGSIAPFMPEPIRKENAAGRANHDLKGKDRVSTGKACGIGDLVHGLQIFAHGFCFFASRI
jgi:hypothetical protein